MSEQKPKSAPSNMRTIIFMVILSFACALILSVMASLLEEPKAVAKELDRSKQMMIAAKLLSHEGYFLLPNKEGKYVPAKYGNGQLVIATTKEFATKAQIQEIYANRIRPVVVNDQGDVKTFEEVNLNFDSYVTQYRKTGYYNQPWKLVYEILPNIVSTDKKTNPNGYVIPVNGFGLWDAIYGYLAIKPDGDTIIGISWYDQKETPGLGANIAEAYWQNLFEGKLLFQESPDGKTDFKTAPLGITVVKGKVAEVLGNSPKAKSAVDGMAGATLTGNGVNDAYRAVLGPYRPFLIKLHDKAISIKEGSK